MSLDKSLPRLKVLVSPEPFQLLQYDPTVLVPASVFAKPYFFLSVTRTPHEITVVLSSDRHVEYIEGMGVPNHHEGPYTALRLEGPLQLDMKGIMASLTDTLARADVAIYALSTWNTDYILVPQEKANDAILALEEDLWIVGEGI